MASSKARTGRRPNRRPSTAGVPLATPNSPARPPSAREDAEPTDAGLIDDEFDEYDEEEETGPALSGPPPWLQWTTLLLALVGLGISIYETYAHYTGNHLAGCSSSVHATFDCMAVITSPQSMVFGIIPVAILGLAFYVFAVAIFSPWAWRSHRREVHWLRLASMVIGIGFVLYLVYAELAQIGQVCEYCTGVHIVTFVLFCITVLSAALWGLRGAGEEVS